MQFTVTINQAKALDWGLNAQQALLFAFVYECPSWAKLFKTDKGDFYALSKAKIVEELPLLTDKPDTAYRLLKAIAGAGLINLSSTNNITLVQLTAKGKEWNKKLDGSEKYPTKEEKVGKKSEPGSEKSPTNQDTSNQDTNQGTSHSVQGAPAAPSQPAGQVVVSSGAPRCEIPADMPGPKDPSCKTFKAWANYAMAYRNRHGAWPVWNAKAGGQIGQLVDRLGIDVAHHVAAYFVRINDSKIVSRMHSLGDLLQNAEAYHTQWFTNRQMTGTTARQIEHTQANFSAAEQALEALRAKRAATHVE